MVYNKCWLNEWKNKWSFQVFYYENYVLSSCYRWGVRISKVLLLSSNFNLFPLLYDTGADPVNISLLPDGSVLVSSTDGHCKARADEGAFHPGLGCFILSKMDSRSQWCQGNPMVLSLQGISLLLSRLISKDQLWSTYILYQVSQPSRLLLQTDSSLYPLARLLASAGCIFMWQQLHFQWGLGVGRELLQALSASILYSPSALEKSTFFHLLFLYSLETSLIPLVVNHS